jgi:uncharacterized protein YceK
MVQITAEGKGLIDVPRAIEVSKIGSRHKMLALDMPFSAVLG